MTKTNFVINCIIVIGAMTIAIAPLAHIVFSKTNPKVEALKKELAISITQIGNELLKNRNDFENNIIQKEIYFDNLDKLTEKKKEVEKQNDELLDQFIDSQRIFGWKTLRIFLIGFGVRLPYLLLALLISFLAHKLNTKNQHLKKSLFWLQVSCYFLSFYFIFWVFWTSQDFPLKTYRWFFICLSALASITTVSFITYKKIFKHKSSKIIEKLILLSITKNKYIKTKKESDKNLKDNMEKISEIIS